MSCQRGVVQRCGGRSEGEYLNKRDKSRMKTFDSSNLLTLVVGCSMPLPSGGLIAAVRNKRRKAKPQDAQDEPLLVEDKAAFRERVLAIQDVLEDIESKILFNPSEKDPETTKEYMIDGLIDMAEAKISRTNSYKKLLGTTTFFIIYIVLLFMQRDYEACYAIESSVMNLIVSKLPTTGSGGYTNSGVGANGFLSNVNEFYSWLNDALIKEVFNDPVCGDGKCDTPDEYPGFGRFGCVIDCGNYLNVTSLTINLEDVVQTSATSLNWDLSSQSVVMDARKAGFKYNIYSQTMGNFLFESDRNDSKLVVDVPDGKFTLVLYQTVKTSEIVDNTALEDLGIVPSTIPDRDSLNDFSYGDKKEFITSSYLLLTGIVDYCFSTSAIYEDPKCSSLSLPDILFRIFAGYGLNGSITSKTSTNSFDTVAEVLSDLENAVVSDDECRFCIAHQFPTGQEELIRLRMSVSSNKQKLRAPPKYRAEQSSNK
eukprot:767716-Hanusia_phi.AAC.2